MIKLLIVDDEPLVQIGIKSMLHWQDLGIEVCGTAMNGEVAFQMIEELSPDIVITDIKMPILNGLDLVKKSRDTFGSIPLFIVLTSYEEFSLIRQAISYQAIDYLVKLELDAAGLESAIRRALERLEELRASEAYRQAGGNTLLQSYDYKDKFFMRLLHNLFDNSEQFHIQAKDLKLDFSDRCYLAVHGEIHSDTAAAMDATRQSNLYSSSLQMIQEILNKHLPCHVLSLDKSHFAVIFHASSDSDLSLSNIQKALDNACTMVHNYFNVWLTLGIGNIADEALKISVSYQEARQAFNLSNREMPCTPFSSVNKDSFRNAFNIAVFKGALTQAFEEFDTDVLYKTLSEITELFAANPQRHIQAVDASCNILYLALSLLPNGEESLQEIFSSYPNGYRSIYKMETVLEVTNWLNTLRDGLCELLKSKRKTYKDHVISNVQKYINAHIEDKLSLNDVAAVFGLSPNYLSALFKKNCSIGFSEYITQRKISRAKTMLLEQNMKIYEAADRLGFESAFYFSKVFKKVEGISPREYIQAKTKEEENI